MSSPQSKLWKARRSAAQRQKTGSAVRGALGTLGAVTQFVGGKMKDSKSAWESYEKGYEAMGGQDFQGRAKFGEKGFLKDLLSGPSGEAFIGEGKDRKRYDIGDITRAGKFLSSDAGAILDEGTKAEYLSSTVRGQAATQTGKLNSSLRTMTGDMNTGFGSGPGIGLENTYGSDARSGVMWKFRGWDLSLIHI